MSFAVPAAMLLTALALPIIALYILKVRLRQVPVSTNLFWKQLYDQKPPRSIWQHFRHLMSLLMQLLILLLLALAAADPYFSWQARQAQRIVLVMDNSASMQAQDVSPSRMQAARSAAHLMLNGLRYNDQVSVIMAGTPPQVVVGMTNHLPTLRRAIDQVQPTDGPSQLEPAIRLARQLIGDQPHGRVIVYTDGCTNLSEELLPGDAARDDFRTVSTSAVATPPAESETAEPDVPVSWQLFGTECANVGITQLQVRRSLIDPLGYEVLAAVYNASPSPVRCRLELSLDGIPVDVLPLTLKAEERWNRSIEKISLEGGRLEATLTQITADDVDASSSASSDAGTLNQLTTDDTAWAILPARTIQNVLIITPGNLFLQKVFEASPLIRVQVQQTFPAEWPEETIIVLHGSIPSELPSGNVFVVDPKNACDAWDLGDVLQNPIVTQQDRDSPLMTHVQLDNVLMPEARQLRFHRPARTLVGVLSGDPVYSELRTQNSRCLVLSIDLDRSDLAFRTAFPVLVMNSLNYFSGESGELHPAMLTGSSTQVSPRTADLPSRLLLKSPSGRIQQLIAADSSPDDAPASPQFTIGPLNEAGIWTIASQQTSTSPPADSNQSRMPASASAAADSADTIVAEYAVNLASERETDLRANKSLLSSEMAEPLTAGWFSRPLWFLLLSAACVLSTLEWFLYQRRLIT